MNQPMKQMPFGTEIESIESRAVHKALLAAHRALAELKGLIKTIPNSALLLNTLALQEAKDSSAIENIITTHDDLYRESVLPDRIDQLAAKEVSRYATALKLGFTKVRESGILPNSTILAIQEAIEKNRAGFRKLPGTVLKNSLGETVYMPPQDATEIENLMGNLEQYINEPKLDDFDPLVKMALIHFQFESIHPFYDGNGRTGRIINILYLVMNDLLDIPVLYLSRYIVQNKADYYRLLQQVREKGLWEEWVLYMIKGVAITARQTMVIVESIVALMATYKVRLREKYPFYSRELLEVLFAHPYTKVEFVQTAMGVSRMTANRYLNALTEGGELTRHSMGRAHYFVNTALFDLLRDLPPLQEPIQ